MSFFPTLPLLSQIPQIQIPPDDKDKDKPITKTRTTEQEQELLQNNNY